MQFIRPSGPRDHGELDEAELEERAFRAELESGEWGVSVQDQAKERKRLAVVRRKNTLARIGMPASRKHLMPLPDSLIVFPQCEHKVPFKDLPGFVGKCPVCQAPVS